MSKEHRGWEMVCDICGQYKYCLSHPTKFSEWSCTECYDKTYFKNGNKRKTKK